MIPRALRAAAVVLAAAGCTSGASSTRAAELAPCVFNDDCASSLVCAAERCRAQCRSDRDCRNGWRCLSAGVVDRYVCYAPDDFANACVWDSHCRGGRVCGGDRVCRAQCRQDYDCAVIAPGLRCLASGVCSSHPFLDGGALADVDLNTIDARSVAVDAASEAGDATRDAATDTGDAASDTGDAASDVSASSDGGAVTRADEPTTVTATGCGPRSDARSCTPGTPGCDAVELLHSRETYSRCVRFSDGSVRCWGSNYAGALGIGTIGMGCPTPFIAQRLHGASSVVLGGGSGCAMFGHGLWCWGSNFQNNIGAGAPRPSYLPIPLGEPSTGEGTVVAGHGNTTCLVSPAGTLRCWGQNTNAELGLGDAAPRTTPVTVPLDEVAQVAPGETHTCALRRDGTVWCWGSNCAGEAGSSPGSSPGITYPVPCGVRVMSPQQVPGVANAVSLALGRYHSCALLADHRVLCWGWNAGGELGNGTTGSYSATPGLVFGLTDAQSLGSGNGFGACVLRADRAVWCWGNSNRGVSSTLPADRGRVTQVPGMTGVRMLARGGTCAVRDDGGVWCWDGVPGDGTGFSSPPREVTF